MHPFFKSILRMDKNAKIYIAGHNGLVGSAILWNLASKGYENILTRSSSQLDLRDKKAVEAFFYEYSPEYVFLAAAKVGGIVANNTYRGEFIYDNLMIQSNVIEAARVFGVKKLLFLGSTCIYPRECPQPIKEEYLLTAPLEYTNEPYAIAKIAGIKLCESYNLQYGTNFISVMPTNLYGPNDNFDLEKSHVLPALVRKMHLAACLENDDWDGIREDLNRRPVGGTDGSAEEAKLLRLLAANGVSRSEDGMVSVEIWGTGSPRREFLWSEDMADACVFVMQNVDFDDIVAINGKPKEVRNVHLNIGTGTDVSIKKLAQLVQETVGFSGTLTFNTSKPDGTLRKLTDPSRLHQLGWKHSVALQEGLERMYAWYCGTGTR
ncbi:MAG: GDP-L-fucose synthase [Candidatus Cyclonatronum sp.]|uniref:GDP-L-fucose synthase family protein n=1 Tax=Cyclonatronum sp. TaxID=3024185 RepID=UPI0025BC409E|nr:GDP-L-fucose synthase [Cyclonatronum sp.]MCH8486065.1 GDP-L-fucose synthase [Cyclonatronum sp.]